MYRDGRSGKTLKLLISALEAAAADTGKPIEVTCEGEMEDIPFKAVGTVGAVSTIAREEEPWPVAFNVKALKASASLNGSVQRPFEFRGIDLGFFLRAGDLRETLAAAGKPAILQGELEIRGRISDPAAQTLRISELMLRLGDNRVSGFIEFKKGTAPLTVHAAVETDTLDLSPFLRKSAGAQGSKSGKSPKKLFPDYRISVPALEHVNGSIKIRAAKLIIPRLSIREWMNQLDGHVLVISDGGRINNRTIELLGSGTSSGIFRMLNPRRELSYTEVRCMVGRFDIQRGQAKITALVMDTPEMTVVGCGEVDLGSEKLDIFLKPNPKQGLADIGLSLGDLASPFKLAGTLSEPTLAIDPAQSALVLGKSVGGVVLFGPVGVVAALAGGTQGGENPCLAARALCGGSSCILMPNNKEISTFP